jgi:hypothetical protein
MLTKNDLETNLKRVHEWIVAADQKVSIFLAFQGVLLTLLFPNIFSWTKNNFYNFSYYNLLFLIIGIFLTIYSLYKSTSAIIPRVTKDGNKKSIIYFGDIAKFNLKDFKKATKETNNDEYEIELVEQIHISSKIATKKHSQFRDAIFTLFAGIILLIISFLLFKI